jgi:1,4-alpha-glucan branching enzyme
MYRRGFTLLLLILCAFGSKAQLLQTTPDFPTDNSPISIVVDCSKGNQGLFNYANTNDVFVHIGVITNLSTSSSDWKYVKFDWGTTLPASKATLIAPNKYQYDIANIRAFFGVPAGETIRKIAILFRNGSGSQVQRTADVAADQGNMYIPIFTAAPAGKFTSPAFDPYFIPRPEAVTRNVGSPIDLVFKTNQAGSLQLFFNGTQIQTAANATSISASPVVTSAGNQQVVGRAVINAVTISDTFNFFAAAPAGVLPLPAGVQEGINYLPGDTSVVLVLYGPGKNTVSVIGDFNDWALSVSGQMNKTPDGKYFWVELRGLEPGREYGYQFLIDRIADFYTEKVLDPSADQFIAASTYPNLKPYPTGKTTGLVSVLQTRAPQYTWRNNNFARPDKRNLVIYEMLVRDFVGAHDFKTIKDTISYLKRLGVNAIELMPVNEFEGNISWGYNTSLYFATDKYYGPKNSLKELIDSCHSNGIAVILDMVLNHSYGQSPMVRMYYDAVNNRPAADNPWFNPVAPHAAITFGFDFNHESAATKYFVDRVLDFWLKEYKVDGFRLDFTKGFTQKTTTTEPALSAYDASRVQILKNINDSIQKTTPGAYVILEHLCDNTEERDLAAAGMMLWGNLNYNFNEASMGYVGTSNFDWATHTARGFAQPLLVSYMESHDEERLMFKNIKYGNSSAPAHNVKDTLIALKRNELATVFYMAIPGPRMIWQFGEIGYDYSRCYLATNGEGGDCNTKTDPRPIRWDYAQQPARKQLYNTYAAMAKLRKDFPATFTTGSLAYNLAGAVKSMYVSSPDLGVMVIGNFEVTATSGQVTFPQAGTWYDYFTGAPLTASGSPQVLNLGAGEYRVFVNKNLNTPPPPGPAPGSFAAYIYPNPLQAASRLVYDLPQNGSVSVAVYDMLGKRLALYNKSSQLAGSYSVSLMEILRGRSLSAGVYLLEVSAGGSETTLRMVVRGR